MRKLIQAGMAAGLLIGLTAAPAQAVTIGETFVPVEDFGGDGAFVQSTSPGNGYAAPFAGVITSWQYQSVAGVTPPMKLKIVRFEGGNDFRTVGDSQMETPEPSALNSWPTRIPVQAGDILGTWYSDSTFSFRRPVAGYASHEHVDTDVPVGATASYSGPNGGNQIDLAAALEPDADGDGFGDETQDQCPTQATTQGACDLTAPSASITKHPKNKIEKNKAKFKFESNEASSTFECKKDKKLWKPCSSPTKMKRLDEGKHKFKVRATDAAGNTGPADKDKFRVV